MHRTQSVDGRRYIVFNDAKAGGEERWAAVATKARVRKFRAYDPKAAHGKGTWTVRAATRHGGTPDAHLVTDGVGEPVRLDVRNAYLGTGATDADLASCGDWLHAAGHLAPMALGELLGGGRPHICLQLKERGR